MLGGGCGSLAGTAAGGESLGSTGPWVAASSPALFVVARVRDVRGRRSSVVARQGGVLAGCAAPC
eukprot:10484642-Lingulodinium_polyedra.AAC.1